MGFLGSLFHFGRLKEELVLVLDIGSVSVGAALVLLSPTGSPLIIYTVRREMKLQHKIDFKSFILSMQETLTAVLNDVGKDGLSDNTFTKRAYSSPEKVYCVLDAPWYASQARVLTLSKNEPFRVSHEIFSEMLNKEIASFKDMEAGRYLHEGIKKGDMELIEKETIHIKLNGYEVANPYNRLTDNLEMLLYLSVVPADVVRVIRDKVMRAFHQERITFHSFVLASFSTVRDIWKDEKDFLLMNMSGEVTEISLVRRGMLLETVSFPLGKNFFIRRIANRLKISVYEAVSLFNLYITEKGSEEAISQTEDILKELKREWLETFHTVLRDLGGGIFLPSRIFLITGSLFMPWFSRLIQETDIVDKNVSTESFTVTRLSHEALSHFVRISEGVEKDSFLLFGAIFAHKIHYLDKS